MKTVLLFTISIWITVSTRSVSTQSFCPTQYLTARPSSSGDRAYLNSPLYPHFYDNNLDCWWIIRTSNSNQRIKLTVFDFQTEACCDKLWLFDSDEAVRNKDRALNVLSGTLLLPYHVVSSSDVLALNFLTNNQTELRGFQISYELTDEVESSVVNIPEEFELPIDSDRSSISTTGVSTCYDENFEAISSLQDFSSPNYPNGYSNNLDCQWSISTVRGQLVQLSFNYLDLEPCCDHIIIKDGGRIVGSLPEDLASKKTYVSTSMEGFVVSMTTDKSVGRGGFRALYRSVSPSNANQPFPSSIPCDRVIMATDTSTPISSPGWPDAYPLNTSCVWEVSTAEDDQVIELTIEQAQFDNCCDYIEISEKNTEAKQYFEVEENLVIQSKSSNLRILFFSDSSVNNKGFKAYVKQVAPPLITPAIQVPSVEQETIFFADDVNIAEFDEKICTIPDNSDMCLNLPPWKNFRKTYKCGFNVIATDEAQELNSPGFPASYGEDQRCRWLISADDGYLVQLTIGSFETESCCDNLKIWGSDEAEEVRLAGNFRHDRSYVSKERSGFAISFRSDASIQMGGFRGLFRRVAVNETLKPLLIRPPCGYQIEVDENVFELTSPGWPDKYSDNLDCMWNLTTSSVGKEIELVIGNLSTEACCDYLEVSGVNISIRIKGELQKSRRILSNGRNLNLHFFSDKSQSSAGFTATVRQIDAESNKMSATGLQKQVGSCKFDLFASSTVKNLTTPGYPFPYDPNMDCVWIIKPQEKKALVKLVIEELITESCCDFLDVYILENDGYDRLRGEISAVRQFTGKSIILRFFSDSTDQRRGFRASYISINLKTEKLNETRTHKNITTQACGSDKLATSGSQILMSPGWPKQYDNDLNCEWNIETTNPNYAVELTVIAVDSEACCDYLEVSGGNETKRFKGSITTPKVILSSRNRLNLKFVTDSNRRQQGFKVEFREVEQESNRVTIPVSGKNNCTNNLQADGDYKQVRSSNFPENYDPNQDCVWIIQSSSSRRLVEIVIEELSTEECCDFVEIYTGKNGYERLKGSLNAPKMYRAQYIVVRFVSDGNIQHRGFQFTYRTVEANINSTEAIESTDEEDACQYTVSATSEKQTIKSSENTLLYPSLTNCSWVITSDEDKQIQLNFTFFETEECCDYVEVFESSNLKANLSGSIKFYSVVSTTNQLVVRFVSDASINMQGFVAEVGAVTAVSEGSLESTSRIRTTDPVDTNRIRTIDPVVTTVAPPSGVGDRTTTASPDTEKDIKTRWIENIIQIPVEEITNPECDSTIYVGDELLPIGSPGYPDLYSSGIYCDSVFEGVNGRRLSITFYDISMETCCDYIDIIDEPSGHRLAKLNMERNYNNLTFTSITHRVKISMFSDDTRASGGYLATIQALPEEDCFRTVLLEPGEPIRITSLDYPQNYPNKNCTWKILNQNSSQIRVTFAELSIEECCDSLQLFDGHENRFMVSLPKGSDKVTFETSEDLLTMKMLVDKSVSKKGFDAIIESFQESYDMFERRGCGHTVTVGESEEILLSPDYPNYFTDDLECHWLFKAEDPFRTVSFFFDEIEIGDPNTEIKIYDGPDTDFPLLHLFDSHNLPEDFIHSTSSSVYIVLKAGDKRASGSFFASFFLDSLDLEQCDMRLSVTDLPLPLTSKGYPAMYQHQTNCTWTLQAEKGKRVEFVIEDIDMETCCDYIEITDGKEYRLIEKVSSMGDSKKLLFRSTTHQMNVRMFSDRSIGGRGFTGIFQAVQEYYDPHACGYTSYVTQGEVKSLTTPNYPNDYPANAECHWLLVPEDIEGQIQLRIDDARLEECCDTLQIRNGFDIDADIIGVIEGYVGPEGREYTSTNGALYIHFKSDISGNYHGFRGQYHLGGRVSSYSHVCTKIENLETGVRSINNNYAQDCGFGSNCLHITSNSVSVRFNENGVTSNGQLEYGGCIPANECEELTCDYLNNVQFEKHNITITNNDDSCHISCCSGDLCNTGGVEVVKGCRETKLDLMFLMDGSGSLNDKEFEDQKSFVKKVSSKFDFDQVHIGVMQYSHWLKWSPLTSAAQTYFETHISIGNYSSYSDFEKALSAVEPHGYTSYVGHAIEKAILEDMTKSERFLDQCTKKAMVVMIDGKASDNRYLKASHRQAKTFNIEMFGVGVDQYRRAELQLIVHGKRGSNEKVFTARNFNKLKTLVDPLHTALNLLL